MTQEELAKLKEKYSELGFIKLMVYRILERGTYKDTGSSNGEDMDETGPVLEEAIKGKSVTHCTR